MEKQTQNIKAYVQRESLFELKRKLIPGVVGHISVTAILMAFTPLLREHFWPVLLMALAIVLSSLTRIPLGRMSDEAIMQNVKRWKTLVYSSLYTTLASWSAIFFYTILNYPLASLSVVLISLIAAGNTANSTSALSSDKVLARIFSTVFMGSIAIAILIAGDSEAYSVALLSVAHLGYHYMQIGIFSTAFRESKEREFKLSFLQDDRKQNSLLLQGILDGLEESVFLKNSEGIIQIANAAAERVMGLPASQLIGRPLDDLMPKRFTDELKQIDAHIIQTGLPFHDTLSDVSEARELHISRSFFPYKDAKGQIIGILSVTRDISGLKHHEESMLQVREELEHRVEERTHDLSILSQSLLISQERLESVLVNAPLILWAIDKDGLISHVEGAGLKKLKADPDKIIGKPLTKLFPDNEAMASQIRRILAGESFSSEDRVSGAWFESHWSTLRDDNGEITGAACLSLDISERKVSEEAMMQSIRLSEIIEMQRQIGNCGLDLNRMMQIVCNYAKDVTASDGAIVEVIDEDDLVFRSATGSAQEFLGLRLPIRGSFSGVALMSREALICNDSWTDDRVNTEIAAKTKMRSMVAVPLRHGNYIVGILKSYSEQPSAFNEQHQEALQLMGELLAASMSQATDFEEKTQAIESMQATEKRLILARAQAEAAAQTKADFLASMSHEIRTPLNGIIGMTELLIDSPLSDEQQRFARIVQNSGNGLLSIINDILDFSKIDAGKMDLEASDFNISLLIEAQAELLSVKAMEKNLQLTTWIDPLIPHSLLGDAGRISQIILNLLSNAIKFTTTGSVVLNAKLLENDRLHATVRWEVIDSGIGISNEIQEKLFMPFTQADGSTARRYGGTGLGLSISKRLVDLMGGTIGIESVEGQGATFWFNLTLPISSHQAQPELEALANISAAKSQTLDHSSRILVVEDNSVNQLLAIQQLKKLGLSCHVVANGRESLEALAQGEFDLILMDCQMPEMDGYQATILIRQSEIGKNRRIPIIAMTANAMREDEEKCRECGMDDFLAKPIKREKLESKLKIWLPELKRSA